MAGQVNAAGHDQARGFRVSHLGGHLLTGLWNGWADAETDGALLRQFYAAVSPEEATEVMWLISNTLQKAQAPESELLARLMSFWEFRLGAVQGGAAPGELAEFGRWFSTGHFEPDWSLRQLLTTLRLAGDINAESAVISRLAELAPSHTQPCLAALERIITTVTGPWWLTQSRDYIRTILTIAIGAGPTTAQTARKIISLLGRDHGMDVRDILRNGSPDISGLA